MIACAQSVISPPGTMPRMSTSAPLSDSTTRTSVGAETVVAVTADGSEVLTRAPTALSAVPR